MDDGTDNICSGSRRVTVHNVAAREIRAYLREVEKEMNNCEAGIIAISAGFDDHEEDWGGTLKTDDYREIGRLVRGAAKSNRAGCFAILEGGYNHRVLGRNAMALIEGLSS